MENLEIDWGYTPQSDRRRYGRITYGYLSKFYGKNSLRVYISTKCGYYTGIILDLSGGGMLLSTSYLIEDGPVKVSFLIGRKKIITMAEVRREKSIDNGYEYGMMFLSLNDGDQEFLNDLFVNKTQKWER